MYPPIGESNLELLLKKQPGKVIQMCIMKHKLNGMHKKLEGIALAESH